MLKSSRKSALRKLIGENTISQAKYIPIIWKNQLLRICSHDKPHSYFFILSPPYCGSTLLNMMLSTSKQVSVNNPYGNREGMELPRVKSKISSYKWHSEHEGNWQMISKEWKKYWNPTKTVFLEKSPSNIVRANVIETHFTPSYFIVFYRDPYAHCEGLMRRNNQDAASAARFAISCLEHQRRNLNQLKNYLSISYEELTENLAATKQRILNFMPMLGDFDIEREFNSHNFKNEKMAIVNLNDEKIEKIDSEDMLQINSVFEKHRGLIESFGYQIRNIAK